MESDNSSIAKVTKKGRIIAVSAGDVKVTAYAQNTAGKKTKIGDITVHVRANASTVSIEGVPENNTFGIGTYTLTADQKAARKDSKGNNLVSTDLVEFSIPEEYKNIAEITAAGVLTTKQLGDFKIQVKTYQSATLDGATASAEIDAKAAVNMTGTTQQSSNSFSLTFDSSIKDIVTTADFDVYYKANTANVKLTLNKLTIDAADSSKAVLSTWQTLSEGTEYFVAFKDQEAKTITAASLNPEDAAQVKVNTTSAVVNILTDIDFTVVNEQGIEIPNVENNVIFSTEDSAVCSISGNQIVFFEKGKTATIKVDYSAWYINSDNQYVEKAFTNYITIVSKEADAVTISDTKWTIGANNTSVFDSSDYVQNTFVAVNDTTDNYLNLSIKLSDGSTIASDDGVSALSYSSADGSILIMDGNTIKPIKEGTTQILVYRDGSAAPIVVIPVTVKPARVPASLTATLSKTTLNSYEFATGFNDAVTVTVTVRDNYGKAFNGSEIKYERISGIALDTNPSAVLPGAWSNGSASFSLTAGSEIAYGTSGSLALRISASANGVTTNSVVLSLTAKSVSGTATSQKLVLSSSSINTLINSSSELSDFAVKVQTAEYKDGYQISAPKDVELDSAANYVNDGAARYYFKLFRGAAEVTNLTGVNDSPYVEDGKVNVISVNSSSKVATKLTAGDYTVRLYKIVVNTDGNVTSKALVDNIALKVTDTQPTMTITKLKNNIDTLSSAGICDAQAFRVVYNSTPELVLLSDSVAANANLRFVTVDGTASIYVREAVYTITFGEYNYEVKTSVGTTLTR